MTRNEKLQQAQAALYVGFGDGCRRANRHAEAATYYRKALIFRPTIREELAAELRASEVYSVGARLGEHAADDATAGAA